VVKNIQADSSSKRFPASIVYTTPPWEKAAARNVHSPSPDLYRSLWARGR